MSPHLEDPSKNRTWATYPLTRFDSLYSGCGIVVGWLVEDRIDTQKLRGALTRLTMKWPMLAGRLEETPPTSMSKNLFHIRIPLGELPAGYSAFELSTSTSSLPISHYVQIPLPVVSDCLPKELFLKGKDTPRSHSDWVKRQLPLTYWHVTHFEPEMNGGRGYSCVGVTFSHGLFDGLGISFVVHALEAEMLGEDWEVPPLPHPGLNENVMLTHMSKAEEEVKATINETVEYFALSIVTVWGAISYVLYHIWQEWWHGARRKMLLVPENVRKKMVDDCRKQLADSGKSDVRVSTGDVLAAWVLKTAHTPETAAPHKTIGFTNMASIRSYFGEELRRYPFNCFVPMPYPSFSVSQLMATPIHDIAYSLAQSRSSLSLAIPVEAHKRLENICNPKRYLPVIPIDSRAEEHLTMSNVTIANVVDVNWRGVGAGRTIGRYKDVIGSPMPITNLCTIAGRLDTGSTVLDVVFTKKRLRLLELALLDLVQQADT